MATKRIVIALFVVTLAAALVVVSRVGGASLPLELLTGLAAFAALAGYAILEVREGAPRGINHGLTRRFRREFVKVPRQDDVVCMWQQNEKERRAA